MQSTKKTRRSYRLITPHTVARHQAGVIKYGNGSEAVRVIEQIERNEGNRAYRIQKKAQTVNTGDYIDQSLQQIGAEAVQELGELIHSTDERIRTKNVQYAIDHIRGKALQRSESKHMSLNIQTVLE